MAGLSSFFFAKGLILFLLRGDSSNFLFNVSRRGGLSSDLWTYGDLAKSVNTAPRAAASACRRNKIPILIPCHRIVAKNGIGGYFGQTTGEMLDVKQWLLAHESKES